MKINEIRELTTEELNKKLEELQKDLLDMRMKQATGNLEKPHQLNVLRKTVARIKTILKERDGSEAK